MFQNVIWGWLARRAVEVGGVAFAIYQIYIGLPPSVQVAIQGVLTGDNSQENLALAIGGLVLAGVGYLWSFRATTAPQVVTADAHKIPLPRKGEEGVSTTRKVETLANAAPAPKTLWERLTIR